VLLMRFGVVFIHLKDLIAVAEARRAAALVQSMVARPGGACVSSLGGEDPRGSVRLAYLCSKVGLLCSGSTTEQREFWARRIPAASQLAGGGGDIYSSCPCALPVFSSNSSSPSGVYRPVYSGRMRGLSLRSHRVRAGIGGASCRGLNRVGRHADT